MQEAKTSSPEEVVVTQHTENCAEMTPSPTTDQDERKVVRKLDKHVVTLITVLYLLSFLDRSNIGNAEIAGMAEDLNLLVNNRYDWLLTIFYIGYMCGQPLLLMWKVFPPHIWATVTMIAWGVVACCQSAAQSWGGMMALRLLLGISEAAFTPGIPYYLSFFFLRKELGFRCGLFLSAAPLANCFGGALAYGITSGHSALANWRLLLLVEGIPTILMAFVVFFYLPDSPVETRFLNEDEKTIARARVTRQVGHVNAQERRGKLDLKDTIAALSDVKSWIAALMYFSCNVSFSSLPVFMPTILQQMGFTAIHAQGLTAPPYLLSWLVTLASTYIADRTQQRGITIMILSTIAGAGYIILAVCTQIGVRYFGIFLCASGLFPTIANMLPWVLNNQGSDTRRGVGFAIFSLMGQVGPFLGTRLFPTNDKPRYVKGASVSAAFMFFNVLLAAGLRYRLSRMNQKLDQEYPTNVDVEMHNGKEEEVSNVEVENYGSSFRYVL